MRDSNPAGSGTVLRPAIDLAVESLRQSFDGGRVRRAIVVSDGELTDSGSAIDGAAAAWRADGISFSGILVGNSNEGETVLSQLARDCNGQFARANSMAGVSVLLRDLRLEAKLAAGVTVRRAFLVEPTREVASSGSSQEIFALGDLHRGEKRRVLLELQVKPGTGRERALAWFSVLSKGPDAKERSPQVLQQVRVLNGTKSPP